MSIRRSKVERDELAPAGRVRSGDEVRLGVVETFELVDLEDADQCGRVDGPDRGDLSSVRTSHVLSRKHDPHLGRQRPCYSPKPRLGACTLAANGRLDAEVLGVVLRAAGSTKTQNSHDPFCEPATLLLLARCSCLGEHWQCGPRGRSRTEAATPLERQATRLLTIAFLLRPSRASRSPWRHRNRPAPAAPGRWSALAIAQMRARVPRRPPSAAGPLPRVRSRGHPAAAGAVPAPAPTA